MASAPAGPIAPVEIAIASPGPRSAWAAAPASLGMLWEALAAIAVDSSARLVSWMKVRPAFDSRRHGSRGQEPRSSGDAVTVPFSLEGQDVEEPHDLEQALHLLRAGDQGEVDSPSRAVLADGERSAHAGGVDERKWAKVECDGAGSIDGAHRLLECRGRGQIELTEQDDRMHRALNYMLDVCNPPSERPGLHPSRGTSTKDSTAMSGSRWLSLRNASTLRPECSSIVAINCTPIVFW